MRWIKKIILTLIVLTVTSQAVAQPTKKFVEHTPSLNNIESSIVLITTANNKKLGAGFIINGNGYILTNSYILANTNQISVILPDKRKIAAKLIYNDEHHGIALIYVSSNHLIPVVLGDSDRVKEGDSIWLLHSCSGVDQKLSHGIVTAHRNLFYKMELISPEDSGCPLLNNQGEVIAIHTALDFGVGPGIHFAIPINRAKNLSALVNKDEKNLEQLIVDLKQADQEGEIYG